MNSEAFMRSIDDLYQRLKELSASKGEEYKRRDDNQFANFERGAQSLGLTREQVLMVYLSKHMDSITTYVKDRAAGKEQIQYAEPITGRIDDAILYLLLLRGMAVQNGVKSVLDGFPRGDGGVHRSNMRCRIDSLPELDSAAEEASRQKRDMIHAQEALDSKDPLAGKETLTVGGVTTPRRTYRLTEEKPTESTGDAPRATYVVSANQAEAIAECEARQLSPGSAALCYPDQLYGVRKGHVVFIHHGNKSDESLHREIEAKCAEQGLTLEVLYR